MNRRAVLAAVAGASSAAVYFGLQRTGDKNFVREEIDVPMVACATADDRNELKFAESYESKLNFAKVKARDLLLRVKDEVGAPGVVVGVSVDGKVVWREGFGFANVETRTRCHEETVMRIASISKSMTMAMVGKLWQDGKLDLDKPVQEYVPKFPMKTFDEKEVEITTRMILSHIGGIRHYVKKGEKAESELSEPNSKKGKEKEKAEKSTREKEVYNKEKYDSIEKALTMFQNDELMFQPGTDYLYTTHGWTLVSAVVEGAGKEEFTKQAKKFFSQLGLHYTKLDESEPIIYNRANYYLTKKNGRLANVPFSDNSYKWAGGGFVSTVGDLLKFGNAMLYSYQWKPKMTLVDGKLVTQYVSEQPIHPIKDLPPGFLKPETVWEMWTVVPQTKGKSHSLRYRENGYGLGWQVIPYVAEFGTTGGGDVQSFHAFHTGAAVGASSALLIKPAEDKSDSQQPPPKGICVAILMNMQNVGLAAVADDIAQIFQRTFCD
ncbi:serine beta-lactamase-like protein LACTB, mitochondrial [Neocloeon triangulifer]|uniref:serine beta-lactamase-like protein LACTB, mitochondrial n=1 Tax=Neocloeon triangulifer TaxID=2078957 RepID=UPI00286F73A9|nr:serine beta-lactamase-like protein LACTB, mitochondrial [Neocloeon triangulifer]